MGLKDLIQILNKIFNRFKEDPFVLLKQNSKTKETFEQSTLRRKLNNVKDILVGLIENRHLVNNQGSERTVCLFKTILNLSCNKKSLVKYFKIWSLVVINSYKSEIAFSKNVAEEDIMILSLKCLERMFFRRTLSYFFVLRTASERLNLNKEAKCERDVLVRRAFDIRSLNLNSRISEVERLIQSKRRYNLRSMFLNWAYKKRSLENVPTIKQAIALENFVI